MRSITAHESSILALSSQRPQNVNENIERFKDQVSPFVLDVMKYMGGLFPEAPSDVKLTGDSINEWADQMHKRSEENKKRKCPTCGHFQ